MEKLSGHPSAGLLCRYWSGTYSIEKQQNPARVYDGFPMTSFPSGDIHALNILLLTISQARGSGLSTWMQIPLCKEDITITTFDGLSQWMEIKVCFMQKFA